MEAFIQCVYVAQIEKKPPHHHGTTISEYHGSFHKYQRHRPMLVHCITLIPFRLIRKNLGNLREFFGQMVHRLPRQKIARTSKNINIKNHSIGWKRSFKSNPKIDRQDRQWREASRISQLGTNHTLISSIIFSLRASVSAKDDVKWCYHFIREKNMPELC